MAYRLPTERRERPNDAATLSYLEHFLEQIETLPAQTKSTFAEIRVIDDKLKSVLSNAQSAAEQAMQRSATKGTPIETARRCYHEFIHLQTSAKEYADKKISLASTMHDSVDSVIGELDRRLIEFENQLKRDGRWPPANPPPTSTLPAQPLPARPPAAKAPRTETPTTPTLTPPPTRAAQKARLRDSEPSSPPASVRTRVGVGSTRSASIAAVAATTTPAASPTPSAGTASAAASPKPESPVPAPGATSVLGNGKPSISAGSAAISSLNVPKTNSEAEPRKGTSPGTGEATADTDVVMSNVGGDTADVATVDDTLYCSCQRVSHGDMIACEGKNCPYEWYHFECVGLKEAPEGMWFCPTCRDKRRKSGGARRKYA